MTPEQRGRELSTLYFNRSEFACKCGCGFDTVDTTLIRMLHNLRGALGKTIITSGCRCPEHNDAIGGSPTSKHLLGQAADIKVSDREPAEVAQWLSRYFGDERHPGYRWGGIKVYSSWVHVDVREHPWRA